MPTVARLLSLSAVLLVAACGSDEAQPPCPFCFDSGGPDAPTVQTLLPPTPPGFNCTPGWLDAALAAYDAPTSSGLDASTTDAPVVDAHAAQDSSHDALHDVAHEASHDATPPHTDASVPHTDATTPKADGSLPDGAVADAVSAADGSADSALHPPGDASPRDATVDAPRDGTLDAPRDSTADTSPRDGTLLDAFASRDALADGGNADACSGFACQVPTCYPGDDTTVSGYAYAPNGMLPLYDVQVFIPTEPLTPLSHGVNPSDPALLRCDRCGVPISGAPISTALSDPTGHFVLHGVPAGHDIPLVVQIGKWRRQTTLAVVDACKDNPLTDPNLTRLPKTQSEGSMPHIALTTGGCDQMGCMLPKVGIDPSEFGSETDGPSKAIHVYYGSLESPSIGGADPSWTSATKLWGDPSGALPSTGKGTINDYDVAVLSCECDEAPDSKGTYGSPTFAWMTDYLNNGGRIFTTDFQYTWYKFSPDRRLGELAAGNSVTGIGDIPGGAPPGSAPVSLVTSFPKAAALASWLAHIYSGIPLPSGAVFASDPGVAKGQINPDDIFDNVDKLACGSTVTWASSPNSMPDGTPSKTIGPRIFTVDTPAGLPAADQCGRGVHLDMHVDGDGQELVADGYPQTGCSAPLKADEATFAFFFFDVSSCIQDETQAPQAPPASK